MQVELTPDAVEQLAAIPISILGRIDQLVRRLERWPQVSGCKPLTGDLKDNFRIRTGDYRLIFRVEAGRIVIWRIANRRDVYEK